MKNLFTFCAMLFTLGSYAQSTVSVKISGVSAGASEQMMKNGDRISWYYADKGGRLQRNVKVEIANVGVKTADKGFAAVEASPDAKGFYKFDANAEVKIKKVDTTKMVSITVVMETTMGNEVFTKVEREFSKIGEPITLDQYMWREGNDKISPEKRLCLNFSAFLQDKTLREKAKEENHAFKLTDFEVYFRQDENQDWVKFPEPLKGKISNGTAVEMTNMMPASIDPSKKLYVRFCVKTPKGNYIWGEYAVEPNEYRKEFRATHYTGEAFDPDAPLK